MIEGFFILLLLHVELIASIDRHTEFQECWQKPAPDKVVVEGCIYTPCKLVEGKNFRGEVHFTVGELICFKRFRVE